MSTATVPAAAPAAGKKPGRVMPVLQRIGRSLMLPVATLPTAALLTRSAAPTCWAARTSR